jgi:hypothetical protein
MSSQHNMLSVPCAFGIDNLYLPFSKEQVYGNYVTMYCKLRRYIKFETYVEMKRFYNRRFQWSKIFNYGSTLSGPHWYRTTATIRGYSSVSITVCNFLWW